MIDKEVSGAESSIKNSEQYDIKTSYYNSNNTRTNSYYPQHATQQNTINQLNLNISSKINEYNAYTVQIHLINKNIENEDILLGRLDDYLQDFE